MGANPNPNKWRIVEALAIYAATTFVVIVGICCRHSLLSSEQGRGGFMESFATGDGRWYRHIAEQGYRHETEKSFSPLSMFPVYPCLARLAGGCTGIAPLAYLLLISHASLAGAFILLSFYIRTRFPQAPRRLTVYALLSLGLFPSSFFLRMAYTESSLLLLTIAAMYGMASGWRPVWIAVIVGIATGVRPTGICLLLPFLLYVREQSPTGAKFLWKLVYLLPLASLGIGGFMIFQYLAFGDPLLFVTHHAVMRRPVNLAEKLGALTTLEPIWSVYAPSSVAYWGYWDDNTRACFSLFFANPLFYMLAIGLIYLGGHNHWLSRHEVLLASALLFVPYVTIGFEAFLLGSARFILVAFPIYIVIGQILSRVHAVSATVILGFSAAMLGMYSALAAAGRPWFF